MKSFTDADVKANGKTSFNYTYDGSDPTFTGKDGRVYHDIPIIELGLSTRLRNCLKREEIAYYSQLMSMDEAELLDIRNIGKKSVMEIRKVKKKVNLLPVPRKQKALPENVSTVSLNACQYIVNNITKKLKINEKLLFDEILPLCVDDEESNCLLELKAGPSLIENLSDIPLLHNSIKEVILHNLESAPFGLGMDELLDLLPDCLKDEAFLVPLLEEMEREGSIISRPDNIYERKYPEAAEYAASLPKKSERIKLQGRLKGKTLAEIGGVLGLSRERVRMPCWRLQLSEYVLRLFGNEGLTFEEFTQLYQMLMEDLGLESDPKLSVTERGYKDRLFASNHVLCSRGLWFRYYNIDSYDFTELLDTLDLNQYKDMELSTLKFFREYPELMKDYDIHDEYELHNLLKKICMRDAYPDVHFGRMPIIEFGKADRNKQVKELLFSIAPVTRRDLVKAYEQEYGVLSQTVEANYLGGLDKYFYAGTYAVDFPMMSGSMLSHMKQLLPGKFYLMSEVYKIFAREFPHADSGLINPLSLRFLGFRSYIDYVVSDKYPTASEFIHEILTKPDSVDMNTFPKGLKDIRAYTSELYSLRAAYEIVEYQPHKYINIHRLEDAGIDKDLLKNYSDKVYKATAHMQYFTVYSLRKSGFTHVLDKAVFGEWFYASILSEDKSHFSYQRMGKNKLFCRGNADVCLKDFLEWLVYSSESLSLDIQDIEDQLTSTYNICIDRNKIIETIKGSSMYYDETANKVYADYTVYSD